MCHLYFKVLLFGVLLGITLPKLDILDTFGQKHSGGEGSIPASTSNNSTAVAYKDPQISIHGEYLLSVRGLGLKSVECVRLLTLHHLAFPVDTNVGRIVVRLGWVPLQPLPESLQLHLLELYPVLESIQRYPVLESIQRYNVFQIAFIALAGLTFVLYAAFGWKRKKPSGRFQLST